MFCFVFLLPLYLSRKYPEIWRLGWRSFMNLSLRQQKVMQPQEKKKLLNWRGCLDFRLLEVVLRPVFTCIPLVFSCQSSLYPSWTRYKKPSIPSLTALIIFGLLVSFPFWWCCTHSKWTPLNWYCISRTVISTFSWRQVGGCVPQPGCYSSYWERDSQKLRIDARRN